nr:hypothetical protein [Tanacetum cinerariifolium]
MRYDSTTRIYSCQLDEQWFNLHKDILKDALQITPINDNDPFMAPPSSDAVIKYGIIHRSNINYAERIWGEFVQSIQSFFTDKKRLTMPSHGTKKITPLLIASIRFTKLIIHHLETKHNIHPRTSSPLHYSYEDNVLENLKFNEKDGREVFGMLILDALLTEEIIGAPYYGRYLAHAAEYQQYLDGKQGMADEEAVPESLKPKTTSSQPPKLKPASTKPSKIVPEKKRKHKPKSPFKLVDEFADEGDPIVEPRINDKEADLQRGIKLSLKDLEARNQGHARPMVFREPDFGRFQPLSEVQGKGKEKVIEEQDACDLLTLQTPKKMSPVDQYIQRCTPTTTGPSDKGQTGSNPGNVADLQPRPSHVVHDGPNLEPMDLAVSDSTQQNPEQMDEEFTTTTYPNVQDNLKLLTGELEQHMANLIQDKLALQESDLPVVDMKEILQQQMFEDNSYQAYDDHKNLFEALQKSLERDYSNKLLVDLDEARRKKRKKRDLPRTPSGSLPPQPPPPPPPSGAYGAPDTRNDHLPKANMSKDWWKPLLEEKDQQLLNLLGPSLLPICQTLRTTGLLHFKGQAYEVAKAFHPNVIHLQFQMEKCYNMLTDPITWVNPESDQVRIDVSRPLPLSGPPSHVTIQIQFFFNKDLDHLRYGNKGSKPALSISKMKVARYPDFGLELLVLEQMWIDEIMRFNEMYKFSDGMLTHILEELDYRVREYRVNQLNPGMNTRFWTNKDVTRSKEFIPSIERRLKTRRIFRNLECFVGGRV